MYDSDKQFPKSDGQDVAHTALKASLSAIPIIGGPVAELFTLVIAPPLQQRQAYWLNELATRVRNLEAKTQLTPEQLRDNPQFIDAVLSATQAGIKTSNREKREALQNAIINSVLADAPAPDVQQLYISLVDTLSPWHLRLLYLFKDPVAWFERKGLDFPEVMMGSLDMMVRSAFPETLEIDLPSVWRDLYNRGLANTDTLGGTMTGAGLRSSRLTDLGKGVVDFTLNQLDETE